jgi:hypothetical protein
MPKAKTIRKEIKKEVKAIKKAAHKAPGARKNLRKALQKATHPTVRGKGGYFGDLGGKIGGFVDGAVGLGKVITGLGDYKVRSNTLMESGRPPQVRNTKFSSTITSHPEYICDIKSSVDFAVTRFPINPGVTSTFPWLASQASGYEQYKPKGILFEFRSTCGDAIGSTDNAMGVVLMATEYNVHLPDFVNKQQMEDHEYTTSVKPSCNALHPIECARNRTVLDDLYVRNDTTNVPDFSFYDMGNFYIATQGQQTGGVTLGELWVTYEFEFLKPSLSPTISNAPAQHWYWDSALGPAPNLTYPLRNLKDLNTGTVTGTGTTKISLAPGSYILVLSLQVATGSGNVSNVSFTNGALHEHWNTDPVSGAPGGSSVRAFSSQADITLLSFDIYTGGGSIETMDYTSDTIDSVDMWIFPIGFSLRAQSRRAVEYDPLALMSKRIDELYMRLCRAQLDPQGNSTNCGTVDVWDECKSDSTPRVSSSRLPYDGVCDRDPQHYRSPITEDLTKSQTNIANLLLDRLGVTTSKTGSPARQA